MQYAIISPVYNLDLSDKLSHMYLVLSWLCKQDPQYANHWVNIRNKYKDAYVICDNGANEGKLVDDLDLLSIAQGIKANEIVLPDEYHNAKITIEKSILFLNKYYDEYLKNKFKTMAVVQGTTREEFMDCYNTFLNDKRIDVLGIGYRNLLEPYGIAMQNMSDRDWKNIGIDNISYLREVLDDNTFYYTLSRLYFLRSEINIPQLNIINKKIHLLGLWNPYELSLYKKVFNNLELQSIRSNDSAAICQAAQANVIFDVKYGVKNKPKAMLEFEKRLTDKQLSLAYKNLEIVKQWVN